MAGGGERLAVEVERRLVGEAGAGAVTGADEVLERLLPRLAVHEMVGQLLVVLAQAVGIEILDRLADGAVKLTSPLAQQTVVRDVLDDGVLEDVRGLLQQPL